MNTSRRATFLFCISIILLTFGSTSIGAQDLDTVSISGLVTDEQNAVIVGAEVSVTLTKTGVTRKVLTDDSGRYRLIQLEPGSYSLTISSAGFATYERKDIHTIAAQNLKIDATLKLAAVVVEPVVVTTADSALVDAKRTVVGTTLTNRDTESLPIPSRSVLDLIFTLPGVAEEPLSTRDLAEDRNVTHAQTPEEAGTVSLSGAPAYSNNLTIDGLDNNDDRAARERVQPSLEAVEEVQVITNQFSAEYGRASGGRINLRTRGGSKDLRGRAIYFFRDEALNANSFRNNSLGLGRLPLQEHVGGFTVSGPTRLKKESLFFVAFERSTTLDSTLVDTLLPTTQNDKFILPLSTAPELRRIENARAPALAAEVAPFVSSVSTPLNNTTFTARGDYQFNETHNSSVVYLGGWLFNLRQSGGSNRLVDALQAKRRNSHSVCYSDNYVASPSIVNQFRLQFSTLRPSFESRTSVQTPVILITFNDSLDATDPARRSGTLVAGSSTASGTERQEDRFQLQEIVSLVAGNNSIKTGVDVHRVRSTFSDLSDLSGTFSFGSAGDFLAGIPSRFRQNFNGGSTQHNTYISFFVQNDWQVLSQLLVSYGLRYEQETIIRDRNNFGPRVAMAYNPLFSGRLVIRAGGGIFYNRALLRTIDDFTLGNQQIFFDTNDLIDHSTGKLMSAAQRRDFIAMHISFPETLTVDSSLVKEFGTLNKDFSRRLDPALVIPSSYQANAGAEFDIGSGYSIEANLTFSRGIHLWREMNINAPVLPNQYRDFASYLASRDFPNFRNSNGIRPLHNSTTAGELVRFNYGHANTPSVSRAVEFGVPVSVINLRSINSTTALEAALAALNDLRPDPSRAEVEQLISVGNSFYRGLTIEIRKRFSAGEPLPITFRAGYTLSKMIDDGVVNTSDALRVGDFRAERARSLQDRRHRFVFSGIFNLPQFLGRIELSPIVKIASGAPFNISLGGTDRNLDDVGNDRPNFTGDIRSLRWRGPGDLIDSGLLNQFSMPAIGQTGNLSRNAGHGPGLFAFDLNVTRELRIGERVRLRPSIEFDNVLNKTVFSFGSEFINFDALGPNASDEQRQKFMDSFLVATRTMRPRQLRLGLRLDF
ncbi:MAG TPA: carboxypeptidase regulatory-like domain-containing protein [Pyrinomonadaceae bacterium]|nr:carboxypeptidase regulatory-like domain-containing protein [Pyrinomonadaceae bacterium]